MKVAIHRLYNNGVEAKTPVVILSATDLDSAEEYFNKNLRGKYNEKWHWCYINMDYKNNRQNRQQNYTKRTIEPNAVSVKSLEDCRYA